MLKLKAGVRSGYALWHFCHSILVSCPCSFRLRSLAQDERRDFGLKHFPWNFSRKRPLLRCPCAFQLSRLARSMGRGLAGAFFSHTLCRLRQKKMAETRNPVAIFCMSDRSRCGAVRILISRASRHFLRAGSLSLWRGANFS